MPLPASSLNRTIGLSGAIATLVGFVVGASVFILPGQLAGIAGPGVIFSYLLASVAALLSCVIAAQIGSAFATSGANYVAVTRLLSPFFGFLIMWFYLAALALGVSLVAYGFADFLRVFVPGVHRQVTAASLVLGFGLLNLFSAKTAVLSQSVMVVIFTAALIIFCAAGLPQVNASLYSPMFPNGMSAVVVAATSAVFSFTGFMVIGDIAEEIKQPAKNIPRALALSFVLVLVVYSAVVIALVGTRPWAELGGMAAPVSTLAFDLMPDWLAKGIGISALLAAATTINGVLLTASRNIFALARNQVMPVYFTAVSSKGIPHWAVAGIVSFCLFCILFSATVLQYALFTVVGFMLFQTLIAIAAFRLPDHLPQVYQQSAFKLQPRTLKLTSVVTVITSLGFTVIACQEEPQVLLALPIYIGLGAAYYIYKQKTLTANPHRAEG